MASAKKGSLKINAAAGKCSMVWAGTGQTCQPYMMHFVANQAPLEHAIQLKGLFRRFGVGTGGLFLKAAQDVYTNKLLWPASEIVRSLLNADPTKRLLDQLK